MVHSQLQICFLAVAVPTFPHEFPLVVVEKVDWHLLVVGLRDFSHVVEGAVLYDVGQFLVCQLFTQEQGDPLHSRLQILNKTRGQQ